MNISEEQIRKDIEYRVAEHKLITYPTYKEHLEISCILNNLIINTKLPFSVIVNKFIELYKCKDNHIVRDLFQCHCIIISSIYDIPNVKQRCENYKQVDERNTVRLELYKEGWKVHQIEKYINKIFFKGQLCIEDLEKYDCLYYNMFSKLNVYRKEKQNKRGRPALPLLVKKYIDNLNKEKVKTNMKHVYEGYNRYTSIKNSLTKEDITVIKESLNKDILCKLGCILED